MKARFRTKVWSDSLVELHQGDCLKVMERLPSGRFALIAADLPYGMTRNEWDTLIPFDALWSAYRRLLRPNGVVVLNAMQPFTTRAIASNPGWFKYCWYWQKLQGTGFLNAKKQPLRLIEELAVFYRQQPTYNPVMTPGEPYGNRKSRSKADDCRSYGGQRIIENGSPTGDRYPVTLLPKFSDPRGRRDGKGHPTTKPVEMLDYLIRTYTDPGDWVLDNTAGSGTTGVAAQALGRHCVLIEKHTPFIDLAIERLTGVRP